MPSLALLFTCALASFLYTSALRPTNGRDLEELKAILKSYKSILYQGKKERGDGKGFSSTKNDGVSPDIWKEMHMSMMERVQAQGFKLEAHKTKTRDGYILTFHRIPHGRSGPTVGRKPAVFLQHGFDGKSDTWVKDFAHQSLAYMLADAGFDVWLGNMRGNAFCRAHERYNPDTDREFWQYSFDQVAKFDLPAMIDYILARTGESKVFYVGHSMGTTAAIAGFTTNQDLASKIKVFVAFAPVTKLGHAQGLLPFIAPYGELVMAILDAYGHIGDLTGPHATDPNVAVTNCNEQIRPNQCEIQLSAVAGYNELNVNRTRLPVYFAQNAGGTSSRTALHLAQSMSTNMFRMFDFGPAENLAVYGQIEPPNYEPRKLTVPTVLFWSDNDYLSPQNATEWLISELRSVTPSPLIYEKLLPNYAHLDYNWGPVSPVLIYKEVVEIFKKYSQ